MIGIDPMYYYTEKTMRAYATKTNSDLYIMRKPEITPPNKTGSIKKHIAWYQKKFISNLLKKYDRVLYIDADILINKDADDIFIKYPDPGLDTIFMFDEMQMKYSTKAQHINIPPHKKEQLLKINHTIFNAGVILIGNKSPLFSHWNDSELMETKTKSFSYEQEYINALIKKYIIKTSRINESFNRMGFLDTPKQWEGINFIHFALGSHFGCRTSTRAYHIRKLYQELYKQQDTITESFIFYIRYIKYRLQRKFKKFR